MTDENPQPRNEITEVKQSNRLLWGGSAVTAAYLFGMGIYVWASWSAVHNMKPDAFATFLSGVFAPLAFLWLVLGFMQQGDELRNSARALWLQGEELRNSVEQQRELVGVTREQVAAEQRDRQLATEEAERSAQPSLYLAFCVLATGSEPFVRYSLRSHGPPCNQVLLFLDGTEIRRLANFAETDEVLVDRQIDVNGEKSPLEVRVQYTDLRGNRRQQTFVADLITAEFAGNETPFGLPYRRGRAELIA